MFVTHDGAALSLLLLLLFTTPLTSRRSVLLLMSPAFMALMVLLVNRSNEAATWPSSASPARLMRAKLSLMRINASSCLRGGSEWRAADARAELSKGSPMACNHSRPTTWQQCCTRAVKAGKHSAAACQLVSSTPSWVHTHLTVMGMGHSSLESAAARA